MNSDHAQFFVRLHRHVRLMGNEVGHGFAVPANHNPRSLLFNFRQETGEPSLGFVHIDGLHDNGG